MDGEYAVRLGGQPVGRVQVIRKGLYYRIRCRCRLSGDRICRLIVRTGGSQENLGIPVPEGGEYCLEKLIPMKKIGEGNMEFLLIPKQETVSGTFVPLCPEEPFHYISRLKDSYLAERNGKTGVVIP